MATNPWPFHTYIRFNDFTYLKYITNVSSLYVHIFSEKPSCIQPVSVAVVRLSIRSMTRFSISSINSFLVNMVIFINSFSPSLPLVKVSPEASVSSKGVSKTVFFVFVGSLSLCFRLMLTRETGPGGSGEEGGGEDKTLSRGGKTRKRNQLRRNRGCLQEAQ